MKTVTFCHAVLTALLATCASSQGTQIATQDEPVADSSLPGYRTGYVIGSMVPSISVTLDHFDAEEGIYYFSLRNGSADMAIGVDLNRFVDSLELDGTSNGSMPAKGEWDWSFRSGQLPEDLVVRAALFSDGRLEGEPRQATALAARIFGCYLQEAAMRLRLDRSMANPELSLEKKQELFNAEVAKLPQRPSPADLKRMGELIPALANCDKLCAATLQKSMQGAKSELGAIMYDYTYKEKTGQQPRGTWLSDWWPQFADANAGPRGIRCTVP